MRAFPIRWLSLTLVFLVGSLASNAQKLGFQLEGNRKRVTIPVEVINNLVIVPVLLNNTIPLKFILDTGVRTAILTKKEYADVLGLTYSKKYTIHGLGNMKAVDAFVTNNVTLNLPGVQGKGHSILALKEDYLRLENYLGVQVHGILGYELFSRFIVRINYKREVVVLISPSKFKAKKRSQALPLTIQDTKPYMNVALEIAGNGRFLAKMLVDTGASNGLFLETDTHDAIRVPEKNITSIIGRGIGGAVTGKVGRADYLEIGEYRIDRPLVHFPDTGQYIGAMFHSQDIARNGSVGGGILAQFTVTFDFAGNKIYFKKTGWSKEMGYNISGISLEVTGINLNQYEIVHLIPGSPGVLAGLHIGDRVLSINGHADSSLALGEINNILNSRAGRRILLKIERDGKQMTLMLRLKNII